MQGMLAALDLEAFQRFIEATGADLRHLLPECLLALTACLLLLLDTFFERARSRKLAWLALAGTFGSFALLIARFGEAPVRIFRAIGAPEGAQGMLAVDDFANFFGVVFLAGTAVTIVLAHVSKELKDCPMGEFYSLLLMAVLGMFLTVEATDLLMIFVSIELLSIPSYVLVGWLKKSRASTEAALKYVIYGSVSAAVMLYGFSLFFGMTGSLKLGAIAALAEAPDSNRYAIALAALLSFAGFGYKMASVPMHFWAPDVYEGAPTSITAWLSVTSKAAGVGLFLRFMDALGLGRLMTQFAEGPTDWVTLVAILSSVTMTLGNLAALFQSNAKRLLAYSSIAHVGYILMGVAAFGASYVAGWQAVAFYLVAYLLMNLGAFTCVLLIANQLGTEEIDGYRGLGVRAPVLALGFAIFLISLIGIPPTAGFTGKFQLFLVAIDQGLIWLVVVAAVNTAISVYYYARILKALYLDETISGERVPVSAVGTGLVLFQVAAVLYLGIFFNQLSGLTREIGILR